MSDADEFSAAWAYRNRHQLKNLYGRTYVAIFEGAVIDWGPKKHK